MTTRNKALSKRSQNNSSRSNHGTLSSSSAAAATTATKQSFQETGQRNFSTRKKYVTWWWLSTSFTMILFGWMAFHYYYVVLAELHRKNSQAPVDMTRVDQTGTANNKDHIQLLVRMNDTAHSILASFHLQLFQHKNMQTMILQTEKANVGSTVSSSSRTIFLKPTGTYTVKISNFSTTTTTTAAAAAAGLELETPIIIHIVGDAILPLVFTFDERYDTWTGSFTLPHISMDGTYQLKVDWPSACVLLRDHDLRSSRGNYINNCALECQPDITLKTRHLDNSEGWALSSKDAATTSTEDNPSRTWSPTLFPSGATWIRIARLNGVPASQEKVTDKGPKQRYVWANPDLIARSTSGDDNQNWVPASTSRLANETASSMLSIPSTVHTPQQQSWFNAFRELSNRELVCWMGGRSAEMVHAQFLAVRGELFSSSQLAFKFHYHPMMRLEQPDETWSQEWKEKFLKCKQIFVLLDDDSFMETAAGEPLSRQEYQAGVTTFLNHLIKAIPDHTFPIWLCTVALESPVRARYETRHCHDDGTNRSTKTYDLNQHPCNTAMFDLFKQKPSLFAPKDQERVRLLDNTDLSIAASSFDRVGGDKSNLYPRRQDILGVVALRNFVLIGSQVQAWREMGQIGKIDGLHRNGRVEPDFELIPYKWN